jgi:hypothetical protein
MNFAKKVMKSMNSEQQGLVEQLLSKLKIEQIMRLQSEEQSNQMMQQMVLNQQQLEVQIRQLKDKDKGNSSPTPRGD